VTTEDEAQAPIPTSRLGPGRRRAIAVSALGALLSLVALAVLTGPPGAPAQTAANTPPVASQSAQTRPSATFPTAEPEPTEDPDIVLGAFIQGAPADPKKIDEYAALTGAMPHIVLWYQEWSGESNAFRAADADAVRSRGAMPVISWGAWAGQAHDPAWTLETILRGTYDAYLHEWTRDVARWGHPIYVILNSEMNGTWYPWSPGVNGSTASEFVQTWRHTVDIARSEGATNIRWVWCPNADNVGELTPFSEVYPGDDYLDWVCLDGYNWGNSQSWSRWQRIEEVFKLSIEEIRAITDKPLLIGETAASEYGGDKAAWITESFQNLTTDLPDIEALIWFNTIKETDWRVNSSPASLEAFRAVVTSGGFAGTLP
jgi:Glycosyl hydrolase family 26